MIDPPPPPPYTLSADILYWTARETGTAFAIRGGKVKNPSFDAHFGFKALAGFPLKRDCWELCGQYTHFHARVTETATDGPFTPTWTHPGLTAPFTVDSVTSRWRLHLGFGDLFLKRRLQISECLTLAPIAGLRAAGVRFKTRINYFEDELSMKNKFWGVGPRFGFESIAALSNYWAFYGRWALSTLFGEFYIHQDEEPSTGKLKYLDDYSALIAVKEMALGLVLCPHSSLSVRLLWELHLLPSQNQWVKFPSSAMPAKTIGNLGNLSLQGLTLGFLFSF